MRVFTQRFRRHRWFVGRHNSAVCTSARSCWQAPAKSGRLRSHPRHPRPHLHGATHQALRTAGDPQIYLHAIAFNLRSGAQAATGADPGHPPPPTSAHAADVHPPPAGRHLGRLLRRDLCPPLGDILFIFRIHRYSGCGYSLRPPRTAPLDAPEPEGRMIVRQARFRKVPGSDAGLRFRREQRGRKAGSASAAERKTLICLFPSCLFSKILRQT